MHSKIFNLSIYFFLKILESYLSNYAKTIYLTFHYYFLEYLYLIWYGYDYFNNMCCCVLSRLYTQVFLIIHSSFPFACFLLRNILNFFFQKYLKVRNYFDLNYVRIFSIFISKFFFKIYIFLHLS